MVSRTAIRMLSRMCLACEPLTCASRKRKQKFPKPFRKEIYDENLPKFVSSHNAAGMLRRWRLHKPISLQGRILSLNLDPQSVTTLQLRPGFVTSVRLPEAVSSVVLGDPGAFKAEHSEAEPQLVFFKPSTPSASRTNALITTRTGREVSLALVSRGTADRSAPVDYVLKYEPPRSFFIEASHPSFLIEETKSLDSAKLPGASPQQRDAGGSEEDMLRDQQTAASTLGRPTVACECWTL